MPFCRGYTIKSTVQNRTEIRLLSLLWIACSKIKTLGIWTVFLATYMRSDFVVLSRAFVVPYSVLPMRWPKDNLIASNQRALLLHTLLSFFEKLLYLFILTSWAGKLKSSNATQKRWIIFKHFKVGMVCQINEILLRKSSTVYLQYTSAVESSLFSIDNLTLPIISAKVLAWGGENVLIQELKYTKVKPRTN